MTGQRAFPRRPRCVDCRPGRTAGQPGRTARRPVAAARSLRATVAAAALVSLCMVGVSMPATQEYSDLAARLRLASATSMTSGTYEKRVQALVNVRRTNHGLPPVRFATCPDGTAERWSRFLAANDLFHHQSMTRVLERCDARYAGETLGRGSMAPRKLVRMWMQSPTHRSILLSTKPRRIGVGARRDLSGRWVVAANFLRF